MFRWRFPLRTRLTMRKRLRFGSNARGWSRCADIRDVSIRGTMAARTHSDWRVFRYVSSMCRHIFCAVSIQNALGQPRNWTDHLLWHHAAHTVDLFQYQTGEEVIAANVFARAYPSEAWHCPRYVNPAQESRLGAVATLSLSFNNDGPLGSTFRYIGDGFDLHRPL